MRRRAKESELPAVDIVAGAQPLAGFVTPSTDSFAVSEPQATLSSGRNAAPPASQGGVSPNVWPHASTTTDARYTNGATNLVTTGEAQATESVRWSPSSRFDGLVAFARRRRRWIAALAVAAVAAGVINRQTDGPAPLAKADVDKQVKSAIDKAVKDLQSQPAPAAQAYRTIAPSLVIIQSTRPGAKDTDAPGSGLGTGVIINDQGAILTALHVVDRATRIRVSFADGTETTATIDSSDPTTTSPCSAPTDCPTCSCPQCSAAACASVTRRIAVGHPLGLVGSISAGVVSGLDRSLSD